MLEAFNLHDQDSVMSYFAEDCVFSMPRGAKPRGDRFVGKKEVRAGLAKRFEGIPDAHYGDDRHWIYGDSGKFLGELHWMPVALLTGWMLPGQSARNIHQGLTQLINK